MGLVCRIAEEANIATVCVSTGRDLTAQVKPPRSVFVNFPMGNNFGAPEHREQQLDILRKSLALVHKADEGGVLIDLTLTWPEPFYYLNRPTRKTA